MVVWVSHFFPVETETFIHGFSPFCLRVFSTWEACWGAIVERYVFIVRRPSHYWHGFHTAPHTKTQSCFENFFLLLRLFSHFTPNSFFSSAPRPFFMCWGTKTTKKNWLLVSTLYFFFLYLSRKDSFFYFKYSFISPFFPYPCLRQQ